MNRPAVTKAKMQRAVKALEEAGKAFGGFRLHPDGTVDVLTSALTSELTSAENAAGEAEWDKALGLQ